MKLIQVVAQNEIKNDALDLVFFNRTELNPILKIYGKMVSRGEWRDYNISSGSSRAVFSILRRTSETPIYNIVKAPKKYQRNSRYSVVTRDGQIINKGNSLEKVLRIFNRRLLKLV